MDRNEEQKKLINEADYIDLTVFIRAFLRLARRYLLLVCPIILCLTACIGLLSRKMVKEQHVAEASFVVGVKLLDDFSYNYTLQEIRGDYIALMSDAFQSVVSSEYMYFLLEEELGWNIPGEIYCNYAYGTNMGGIYVISDSMENAIQLRDAVISCLPRALYTSIGDIELKVLGKTESSEVLHEELQSKAIWAAAGIAGGVFAYLGIIFLLTLLCHDIETAEDMAKITDLPCLGILQKSGKKAPDLQSDPNQTSDTYVAANSSFSEFRRRLADVLEEQQVKTLLFTGGYRKRGQTKILGKLVDEWTSQGKKVRSMNADLSEEPKSTVQIQEELKQQIREALKEADLLIINGPDYDRTVELLSAADCVDGIVYIVKAGYDQMESTKQAISTLGFTQAKFLGYVINT